MTLEQLRLLHPRFIYRNYAVTQTSDTLQIAFEFVLEPDIVFRPTIAIPYRAALNTEMIAPYVFRLGIVEALSYWKAALPKEFVIAAGSLSPFELRFWSDLFRHGLGELYYRNDIDFTAPDFLRLSATGPDRPISGAPPEADTSADLVLIGGGKDSAVTIGMYKESVRSIQPLVLNPTEAAREHCRIAGSDTAIIVRRSIDPLLFQLNKAGYINGHTPFSAYLAFLSVMVAKLYGNQHVVVSNERSAEEGNVVYRGVEVNHQYSKSFRFEQLFRQYMAEVFVDAPNYFSILRPLNDIQIGRLFSLYPEFFSSFRSCNAGSKTNAWCGMCPKCAFTYLMLFPFLPYRQMVTSFGGDLFYRQEILSHLRALVGLTQVKPFECVGTRKESQLAVYLSIEAYARNGREIPQGLVAIKSDLGLSPAAILQMKDELLEDWGDTFNLPPQHLAMLRGVWERVSLRTNT